LPPPLKDELQAAFHARLRGFDVIQLNSDGTTSNYSGHRESTDE
jgi:hypothetical protein